MVSICRRPPTTLAPLVFTRQTRVVLPASVAELENEDRVVQSFSQKADPKSRSSRYELHLYTQDLFPIIHDLGQVKDVDFRL